MKKMVELYEAYSVKEANEKMKQGWVLKDVFATPEKMVYVLMLFDETEGKAQR